MEQYWLPKEMDFVNLRYCLDNYQANDLFIRLMGSHGGDIKVNEKLENKVLDFSVDKSGFHFIIDKNEVFNLPLKDYKDKDMKGFSLAYERVETLDDGLTRMVFGSDDDPYDKTLPEPEYSTLRAVWDYHLVEVGFKGRIDIKFHSWWDKKLRWKYWDIVK